MQNDYSQFEQRKQDHIELALMPSNQSSELNVFDRIHLRHEALPDLNFSDISLEGTRFGKVVPKPLLVSSMTAGHSNAAAINKHLIEACAQSGWAMGVGSQRRELTDKNASREWKLVRRNYPNVSLFSNIGIAQIINTSINQINALLDSLQAEALIVHCNPLQEVIQPEGTTDFKGCWHTLALLVQSLEQPVIIKETGCGFSQSTLNRLNDIGIAAVDVSGVGGTHWGRIEGHRAAHDPIRHQTAHTFSNWGIDTINSVKNASSLSPKVELWGSGGVRNGLDAAKLFALGVTTVGFAKPMLEAALNDAESVVQRMATIEYELKTALFCTGSATLAALKENACL